MLKIFCNTNDYRGEETKVYKSESVIKDVCDICNNNYLSKLDGYGKAFIEEYFLKEYNRDSNLVLNYDYDKLKRWLMKLVYNSERANKREVYFYHNKIQYMLNGEHYYSGNVSIYAGLFVNTSPIPLFWTGNVQLLLQHDAFLCLEGIIVPKDPIGKYYGVNKDMERFHIDGLRSVHQIKFGSGLFLVTFWKDELNKKEFDDYSKVIDILFPYKLLIPDGETTIERCTHAFNAFAPQVIDSNLGISNADFLDLGISKGKDNNDIRKELEKGWNEHVSSVRTDFTHKKESDKKNRKK